MKFKKGKIAYSGFLGLISLLIIPKAVYSSPSNYFEDRRECIENPDFISPSTKEYKYCLTENVIIKKYDDFDNLVEMDLKLDELVKEKFKKEIKKKWNNIIRVSKPFKKLIEYKIDDEELFKYSCEAKRERGKLICKNKGQKKLVGIRPEGFYLKKVLKDIENKKWDK